MVNLGDLQERIKKDPCLREELQKDPVAFFEKEGIVLSEEMKESLKEQIKIATSPTDQVPGSSIGPKIDRAGGVMIAISKDF